MHVQVPVHVLPQKFYLSSNESESKAILSEHPQFQMSLWMPYFRAGETYKSLDPMHGDKAVDQQTIHEIHFPGEFQAKATALEILCTETPEEPNEEEKAFLEVIQSGGEGPVQYRIQDPVLLPGPGPKKTMEALQKVLLEQLKRHNHGLERHNHDASPLPLKVYVSGPIGLYNGSCGEKMVESLLSTAIQEAYLELITGVADCCVVAGYRGSDFDGHTPWLLESASTGPGWSGLKAWNGDHKQSLQRNVEDASLFAAGDFPMLVYYRRVDWNLHYCIFTFSQRCWFSGANFGGGA